MRSARAMTLLEVVLAVTLLAAMSSLIAALWSQSFRWTGDSASHHRAMRLPRVIEMMRSQWADRRTSARLNQSGLTAMSDTESLTFISATAILEPGWPLVRATFRIERDHDAEGAGANSWRLVYEEMPLVDLAKSQGLPGVRPDITEQVSARLIGSPPVRKTVLLGGCSELVWERFGKDRRLEEPDLAVPAAPINPDAEIEPAPITATDEERAYQWRRIEREYRGPLSAVRLAGNYEERPFACVFVIGDSR